MKNESKECPIQSLLNAIVLDYSRWSIGSSLMERSGIDSRVEEFRDELSVKHGSKYIKIMSGSSVWGFIMAKDDSKFKEGDILKAASYNAPARNKPRGNIHESYEIQWTGPNYL